MDPDTTLEEMLALAQAILDHDDGDDEVVIEDAVALAGRVKALDEWLHTRGFRPVRWNGGNDAA